MEKLIIGAGQLGSRHLQSLKKLSRDVSIQVVELDCENTLRFDPGRLDEQEG